MGCWRSSGTVIATPPPSKAIRQLFLSAQFSKQSKSSDSFDFHIPNFWELRTRQEKHWTEKTYWPMLERFNCLPVPRSKKKAKWNCSLLHKEGSQTPSSFMPTLQIHLSISWRMHQEFQRQADLNSDRTHSLPMRSKFLAQFPTLQLDRATENSLTPSAEKTQTSHIEARGLGCCLVQFWILDYWEQPGPTTPLQSAFLPI